MDMREKGILPFSEILNLHGSTSLCVSINAWIVSTDFDNLDMEWED